MLPESVRTPSPVSGKVAAFLAIVVIALGCRRGVTPVELSGVYQVRYDYGTEQVLIQPDGTFEQAFAEKGKAFVVLNRGFWKLTEGDVWDGQLLHLEGGTLIDNGYGERLEHSLKGVQRRLRIRKGWFGRVRLLINEEADLSLEKTESKE